MAMLPLSSFEKLTVKTYLGLRFTKGSFTAYLRLSHYKCYRILASLDV
jgi:hypothetical protein